ncbi:MAG: 50S ribosomal protein L15 [Anaerolineales bacterium]
MELHDLKPRPNSKRDRKRVGRGRAAGQGKTAGRGTKGYGARAGSGGKLYFQGGNLPFFRRLPFKRGFTNVNRREWQELNVSDLGQFSANANVDPTSLSDAGLVDGTINPVVVLGMGELDVALNVRVHRVSKTAKKKIEGAGGSVEILDE